MRVRFKVCCIRDEDEVALSVDAGASAVGLVTAMPSGPGVITDADAARIARMAPPGIASFLLTSRTSADAIIQQQRAIGANVLQLCDAVAEADLCAVRTALPGIGIVQVLHVEGPASLADAERLAPLVDAFLLDSGRPSAAVKELGGTGRTHDWSVSAELVRRARVPVWLAGGLSPANAAEAIRAVRPFGLDVCSGLRIDGKLDEDKLRSFAREIARTGGA